MKHYPNITSMLSTVQPTDPVYCIHPQRYRSTAQEFVGKFSGRVLYAVKANDHALVLKTLHDNGVRHFDCASLDEIKRVKSVCPDGKCYFMTPVRLRGAARQAATEYGVRHFVIDHLSGLHALAGEVDLTKCVVFARMAVHHEAAKHDLSVRFGAPEEDMKDLLQAIADLGSEPALAFNVGSNVGKAQAYAYSIGVAEKVLNSLPFKIRLVDIGGGFAKSYPGFEMPSLSDYFSTIEQAAKRLPLADNNEIMCEPGRALAAPGMSAVVEILLKKEQRLFLNDGMFGIFWELRFDGHDQFPVRAFRKSTLLDGPRETFSLFGPTCDSTDTLPGKLQLPADIAVGDYLEFSDIGAYSLAGRTSFNGFYSDDIITIGD